jgi:hypothetical protein
MHHVHVVVSDDRATLATLADVGTATADYP